MIKVLVGCEHSQIVTEAFTKAGCHAISCDLEYEGEKGLPHYKGDINDLLSEQFHLFICHPPCTRLTNSVWSYVVKNNLYHEVEQAAYFFNKMLYADFPYVCIENPCMNNYAKKLIQGPLQYIQPYDYGDDYSKKTGLWLRNLPPLKKTDYCAPAYFANGKPRWSNQTPGGHCRLGPGQRHDPALRRKMRSRFFPGVAKAMADQWVPLIKEKLGL